MSSQTCTYQGSPTPGSAGAVPGDTSVDLTASSTYVSCGDRYDFAGTTSFSVECWFYPTSAPAYGTVVGEDFNSSTTSSVRTGWGLVFLPDSAGTSYARKVSFERWSAGTQHSTNSSSSLTLAAWHHLVGTYDGSNLRLYGDGSLVSGPTADTLSITNQSSTLLFGRQSSESNPYTAGRLDEVAVYTKVLTAAQVSAHYAARVS